MPKSENVLRGDVFFGLPLKRLHPVHRGEQLAGLALGTQPDLAGAPPCPASS
jgi:hypothetical protein